MLILFFARLLCIFAFPVIKNLMKQKQKLLVKELLVVWYSGLIRGSIPFALTLGIRSENREILLGIVTIIVLFTTLILSSFLGSFTEIVGLIPEGNKY